MKKLKVALCGNPNVGKSTVFNALTGLKQHTGNWAGKTVEVARGFVSTSESRWELIDLPGAYSLLNGSVEEIVASDYLTFEKPDAVIVVCDALSLERNLNLALQIAQNCPRTVLCINMMDEANKAGVSIDCSKLQAMLQIPVIGICARKKSGLQQLIQRTEEIALSNATCMDNILAYPAEIDDALQSMTDCLKKHAASLCERESGRLAALRVLVSDEAYIQKLSLYSVQPDELHKAIEKVQKTLLSNGYSRQKLIQALISESYRKARAICQETVSQSCNDGKRSLRFDRLLCRKWAAALAGIVLLGSVLFLTILGANWPSAWLGAQLNRVGEYLQTFLKWLSLPGWLQDLLINGVYRVTSWVVSVMLPPMAIFFPLFTLLEDMGLLPRIAFHLDHCFHKCHSCGKQALCMCMGLGCNAVGVEGCRIIQSPRERLVALLTNSLTPCNGRFPALIAIITMFFTSGNGIMQTVTGTAFLLLTLMLSMCVTLLTSWFLSKTVLSGVASAFALELPPYRQPQWGEVLVRSLLDRTLFVLGRAVAVAAPAGAVVWGLSNISVGGSSLLQLFSGILQPFGSLFGMDGVILLAFMLGFPANELVLPLMLMIYQKQTVLLDIHGFEAVRQILLQNGWSVWTAAAVAVFTLFHWPCSTTVLTLWKETRSLRWTCLGVLLPACAGLLLCSLIKMISLLPIW